MKQQINFRASDLTIRQLKELAERWGANQTEVVTVAIDRAYEQEKAMSRELVHTYFAGPREGGRWAVFHEIWEGKKRLDERIVKVFADQVEAQAFASTMRNQQVNTEEVRY